MTAKTSDPRNIKKNVALQLLHYSWHRCLCSSDVGSGPMHNWCKAWKKRSEKYFTKFGLWRILFIPGLVRINNAYLAPKNQSFSFWNFAPKTNNSYFKILHIIILIFAPKSNFIRYFDNRLKKHFVWILTLKIPHFLMTEVGFKCHTFNWIIQLYHHCFYDCLGAKFKSICTLLICTKHKKQERRGTY